MKNRLFRLPVLNSWQIYAFLSLLFLVMRLIPILTAVERISHYDELDLGMIVKEWFRGASFPLWQYQIDSYGGESLVLAFTAMPFAALLGCTLFAVKMPSLIFSFLTFTLSFLWAKRFWGERQAWWTALLLIFCPPSFVQFSLAALSGHTEVLALSMAALYCFTDAFWGSGKLRSFFLFGLFSGLAFWFYQEAILLTIACLITWIFTDRRTFFSSRILLAVGGIFLGAIPILLHAAYSTAYSASFFLDQWGLTARNFSSLKEVLAKCFSLLFHVLPLSFSFFPGFGIHERVLSWGFFILLVLLACSSLFFVMKTERKEKLGKMLPLLVYPVVFAVFFSFTPFSAAHDIGYIGYRYLSPLLFFAILFLGIGAACAKITRIGLIALILLGGVSQTALMFQEPFARAFHYKGDSFFRVGTQWFYSLFPVIRSASDLSEALAQRPENDSFYLAWGLADAAMGNQTNSLLHEETRVIPFESIKELLPKPYSPFLYEWLGVLHASEDDALGTLKIKYPDAPERYIEKGYIEEWFALRYHEHLSCPECVKTPHAQSRWFYLKLGENYFYHIESDPKSYDSFGRLKSAPVEALLERIRALPFAKEQKNLILSGLALGHLRTSWDSNTLLTPSLHVFLAAMKPEELPAFYWGIGWIARSINREDRIRAQDSLREIPLSYQQDAKAGFSNFEEWYGITE